MTVYSFLERLHKIVVKSSDFLNCLFISSLSDVSDDIFILHDQNRS